MVDAIETYRVKIRGTRPLIMHKFNPETTRRRTGDIPDPVEEAKKAIYRDENGRSRSAISLMVSEDGIKWIDFPFNPIISPKDGWKKALVYQLDMVDYNGRKIIYYNARDGWREGKERIGACELLPSGGDV